MALRGPSGSGKSTLLAVLAGLTDPEARTDGAVDGLPDVVASVPQFPRTTGATVADELRRHAGSEPGVDEIVGEAYAVEALDRVGASALAGRAPESLSPGELQRVAFARALVRVRRGARLLLLDEPTAHLDDDARALVAEALLGLRGTVTTLVVTHDPLLAALADRTVDLPAPAATTVPPAPLRGAAVRSSAPSAEELPTAPAPVRGAMRRAVAAGALSSGAGVALTAVSGWLIVRAAEMPPILTLLVAIVGVRFFGLGRALLRWLERMTAHDAALRMAAATRVRVWSALAEQGIAADRTPGAALARVVGDVGVVQDLTVRVRPPLLVAAVVTTATVAALALVDAAAAGAVGLVLALAVALVLLVHRRLDAGAARADSTLRVAALQETATVLHGLPDLRAHGLADRVAADLDQLADRQAIAARTGTRAAAVGTGLVVLGTGLAAVLATAVGARDGLTGPALAVLALAPLALAEPLAGMVAALQRRGALADAQARLDAVLDAPVPADPAEPLPAPAPVREVEVERLTAGWPGGPDVLRRLDAVARAGDGWLVVRGPSGSGKSTFLAVLMAALRPRDGAYRADGTDTARLAGGDLRSRIAWLPQEAHVFASTVRANLALAAPHDALGGHEGEQRMRAALAARASPPAGRPARRPGHLGGRRRDRPVGRRASPAGGGPGAARRPRRRAAGRADRPPRRAHGRRAARRPAAGAGRPGRRLRDPRRGRAPRRHRRPALHRERAGLIRRTPAPGCRAWTLPSPHTSSSA